MTLTIDLTGLKRAFHGSALVFCCCLQPCPAWTGEDDWVEVQRVAEGVIYHAPVENSPVPRVMIRATFETIPAVVHALVFDYDRFAGFIPNVLESRVVLVEGSRRWVYHRLQFPAPLADRVYLMESTDSGSRPSDQQYHVAWALSKRDIAGIDLSSGVIPEALSGSWDLRPGAQPGTTRAEYTIHVLPGGYVPAWLVTGMTDRYVQQLVGAIRRHLAG